MALGKSMLMDMLELAFLLGLEATCRKEKFTLFSDHNGSLLRQQPGARQGKF